jgi:multicomponent Na+:H+ antiporter subunit F
MVTLPNFVLFVIFPMLAASVVLTFVRLVKGPSTADRVVALDLLSLVGVGFIVGAAIWTGEVNFMDIAIILSVLGFLTTVAFAYYLERSL